MRKTRKFLAAAALVAAFTLVGGTTASANATQSGSLRCSGYYPTPTLRSNTTGIVAHSWYDSTLDETWSRSWASNGVHTSTGWTNDPNYWGLAADSILSASGTCA